MGIEEYEFLPLGLRRMLLRARSSGPFLSMRLFGVAFVAFVILVFPTLWISYANAIDRPGSGTKYGVYKSGWGAPLFDRVALFMGFGTLRTEACSGITTPQVYDYNPKVHDLHETMAGLDRGECEPERLEYTEDVWSEERSQLVRTDHGMPLQSMCDPDYVHVLVAGDAGVTDGMLTLINSVIYNYPCAEERLVIHIVTMDHLFTWKKINKIPECHNPELGLVGEEDPPQTFDESMRCLNNLFPGVKFHIYEFISDHVEKVLMGWTSTQRLASPLNFARFYVSSMLPMCIPRVVYLDTDTLVLGDIEDMYRSDIDGKVVGMAQVKCQAHPSCWPPIMYNYFNKRNFWGTPVSDAFWEVATKCPSNPGTMLIDLGAWRYHRVTRHIEKLYRVHKKMFIWDLVTMPPIVLMFAGKSYPLSHKWNTFDMGCMRCLDHKVDGASILHWSCANKPWIMDNDLRVAKGCKSYKIWDEYHVLGVANTKKAKSKLTGTQTQGQQCHTESNLLPPSLLSQPHARPTDEVINCSMLDFSDDALTILSAATKKWKAEDQTLPLDERASPHRRAKLHDDMAYDILGLP
eukprot:Clim_evm43s77 gene=Clim_evmTU43s77